MFVNVSLSSMIYSGHGIWLKWSRPVVVSWENSQSKIGISGHLSGMCLVRAYRRTSYLFVYWHSSPMRKILLIIVRNGLASFQYNLLSQKHCQFICYSYSSGPRLNYSDGCCCYASLPVIRCLFIAKTFSWFSRHFTAACLLDAHMSSQ